MGETMSSIKVSVSRDRGALLDEVCTKFRQAVRNYRLLGCKVDHAVQNVALDFGVPPSRARQLAYRDNIWSIAVQEAEKLMARWDRHLDAVEDHVDERREALRTQRRQQRLVLECGSVSGDQSPSSSIGSGSGTTSAKVDKAREKAKRIRTEIAWDEVRKR